MFCFLDLQINTKKLNHMRTIRITSYLLTLAIVCVFMTGIPLFAMETNNDGAIRPYPENPWYWEYKGNPVLLIGGSDDHNHFQWTGERLINQLDLLISVGGNYMRNIMSDRESYNVYAFKEIRDGQYDLDQWNEEYWKRLEFFLDETTKRDIIVQLTLWDHFDISSPDRWRAHPWNPENNINMAQGTWTGRRDFYATIEKNDQQGLEYQQRFVDKILSVTLKYKNVLYNINNESDEGELWENYWAEYINRAAEVNGRRVYITTLQFDAASAVRHVLSHRDIYSFAEISQNNQDSRGGRGQGHWDNIMVWREKIASHHGGPMPMNNEKVYGAIDGTNYSAGTESEAINRFWRNIFAGCASSRFHRPAPPRMWGSGLNARVQTNLKAMQMLLEELDIFSCVPQNYLLIDRVQVPTTVEAYATANIGKQYAVFFPQGRYSINLDPWVFVNELKVRWLDIDQLKWSDPEIIQVEWDGSLQDWGHRGTVRLTTPGNRSYVVLLEVIE
jgi:hypothetical protein